MSPTVIAVAAAEERARCKLTAGGLTPHLIRRDTSFVHIALTATQMLLLDGDRVDLDIKVGPGCKLYLQDTGGMVAYPRRVPVEHFNNEVDASPPESDQTPPAQWHIRAEVQAGGSLVWEGLPFVISDGADVLRSAEVRLGAHATALLRETLVLGREGERGGRIVSRMCINDTGGPILAEETVLEGNRPMPGILGGHRILDQVTAAGFRPQTSPEDMILEQPGAISRYLGSEAHTSPVLSTFRKWSEQNNMSCDASRLELLDR